MKIRTRFLLFLLPTLIGSVALVSTFLAYNWYGEIVDGFKTRLKTAIVGAAALTSPKEVEKKSPPSKELRRIQEELGISRLYLLPLHASHLASIPKEVHITPIYKAIDEEKKVMTGYAPIFDPSGHVMGLVAADIHVDLIEEKFREGLFLILLSAAFTVLLVVATLFFIANKISRPVQQLQSSALAIAAGRYGESIQVQGPNEIVELANTLNTMSECLLENINRLKENSLLRERMYGEYECSRLLQHLMLQKNIDDCRSDLLAIRSITFFSDNPRGLLLDIPKAQKQDPFPIHLIEAEEEGLEGMYQLLTQYKFSKDPPSQTSLLLHRSSQELRAKGSHLPFVWSLDRRQFLPAFPEPCKIEAGDFFFLFNRGLFRFYQERGRVADLLAKVLRVFASEGLETATSMLQKELTLVLKRKEIEEDLHLLCFQLLNI